MTIVVKTCQYRVHSFTVGINITKLIKKRLKSASRKRMKFGLDKVGHNIVPDLMRDLFEWLKKSDKHILIMLCISL